MRRIGACADCGGASSGCTYSTAVLTVAVLTMAVPFSTAVLTVAALTTAMPTIGLYL